jgi:alpha-1,3-mannosyltransferase
VLYCAVSAALIPSFHLQVSCDCLLSQVLLGLPFLLSYPTSYVSRAFELSRVFTHTWTVNWKFLPPAVFTSKLLATGLLASHLVVLLAFAHFIWLADTGGLPSFLQRLGLLPYSQLASLQSVRGSGKLRGNAGGASSLPLERHTIGWFSSGWRDPPSTIVYCLFTCNFVGIVFARTLHYQFYCWYFHALPWLLWGATNLPVPLRILILIGIEYAFNVGDAAGAASALSSAVLQQSHWLLLAALIFTGLSMRVKGGK